MISRYPNTAHGRGVAVPRQTWRRNAVRNEWLEILGTSGSGGADSDAFCGFALKPSTCEAIFAAAGGHPGQDNRVVSIGFLQDAPSWITRKTATTSPNDPTADNDSYNLSDGTPMARHLYNYIQYVESLDRVFLVGGYGIGSAAWTTKHVDAFHLSTNLWDAAGTWADPSVTTFGNAQDGAGVIYTAGGYTFTPATNTWGTHSLTLGRFPVAYDPFRNEFFSLQWGDSQSGSGITAERAVIGGASSAITLNSIGGAVEQFGTDAPYYSGMDFDLVNRWYLFYCGQGSGAGRVYKIVPNGTTTWGMSILTLGSGSVTPDAVISAGVNKRFQYAAELGGFLMLPRKTSNFFFLPTTD